MTEDLTESSLERLAAEIKRARERGEPTRRKIVGIEHVHSFDRRGRHRYLGCRFIDDGATFGTAAHPTPDKPMNWRKLKKLARKIGRGTTEVVEIDVKDRSE